MALTTRDIAKKLDLSHTTVSRVLNGRADGFISDKTRRRVEETAREMGYQPNRLARALVTGRSNLIGLCMWDLASAYYASVIGHAEAQLRDSQYHVIVSRLGSGRVESPLAAARNIFPWPLDGVLTLDAGDVLRAQRETQQQWPAPIVSMGGVVALVEHLDCVGIDLQAGVKQAIEHLLDVGCARIAFVSNVRLNQDADIGNQDTDIRFRAYTQAMQSARRKPEYVALSSQKRATARLEMKDYIAAHGCPDGILCINDEVALGVYRALREMKLRVPHDVALIGCDGIEDTEYLECPLSTIVLPSEEMCRLAWQMLQERIENPALEPRHVVLMPHLAIRESTRRASTSKKDGGGLQASERVSAVSNRKSPHGAGV